MTRVFDAIFFLCYFPFKFIPTPLGDPFRLLICRIFGMRTGWGTIREGVTIWEPWLVSAGRNWTLNEGCMLLPGGKIHIGNDVRIAPRSIILATNHRFSNPDIPIRLQGMENSDTNIGDDCWIGANCTILSGVSLGRGCVVAAGAVVTKNHPGFSILGGVPAKIIGHRGNKEL